MTWGRASDPAPAAATPPPSPGPRAGRPVAPSPAERRARGADWWVQKFKPNSSEGAGAGEGGDILGPGKARVGRGKDGDGDRKEKEGKASTGFPVDSGRRRGVVRWVKPQELGGRCRERSPSRRAPRPGVSGPSSGGRRDRQPVPAARLPVAGPPLPPCRALAPASLAAEGFRREKALLPVPALNYHQPA